MLVFLQDLSGQEPAMWHLTDNDGLPSQTVYHIAQDSKGYIWMGTAKGLCRFDGKVFKSYKSAELNDNEILKVEEDIFGRIWFRNASGQLFYVEAEVIHNAQDLLPDQVESIADFVVQDAAIWISFKKEKGQSIAHIPFDEHGVLFPPVSYAFSSMALSSFTVSGQHLWIMTLNSLGDYRAIQLHEKETAWLVNDFYSFVGLRKILLTHNGVHYLSYSDDQILKLVGDQVEPFIDLKDGTGINGMSIIEDQFWIRTQKGVFRYPIANAIEGEQNKILDQVTVNHLMTDHEHNIWMATTGQGVYIVTSTFTDVFHTGNYDLSSNEIYSLAYDTLKKRLLVGHSNSLVSLIDAQNNSQKIALNASGRVVDILIDQEHNYWFATRLGLSVFDSKMIEKYQLSGGSGVKTLLKAKDNHLWIGNYKDVIRLSKEKVKMLENITSSLIHDVILPEKTYAIWETYSDDIWLGTVKGIYHYRDTLTPFLEKGNHLSYNVSSITQTSDSVIWVATRGDGLLGIKGKEVRFRYTEADGLASNTVLKLFATNTALWIGTDNGLNKLDLQSKKWQWINTADGLPSNEINDIEVVEDQVWLGTPKGLVHFAAAAIHLNEAPPPIHISAIKIAEKDTLLRDSLSILYDQNSIQIEFVGIGYKGKGTISYEYKMSGVEKKWISTTSRFVRYPNLPSGNYTFEVYAINEDGIRSVQPASVYFSIQPPWWQTWWFRLAVLLVVAGIIAAIVNARMQRQKQAQLFLKNVNDLKVKALRAQMNPHFIFNALNAIQQFLTTNNREQAMSYLSRFAKLIRLIFEQSEQEEISLDEELEFLNLYLDLEKLRFMDSVSIQLNVDPALRLISDEIYIPSLLIQPIIENSFKHGFLQHKEQGKLSIHFSREAAYLVCTIEDNGVGRKKSIELSPKSLKERPASGLKTTEARLNVDHVVKKNKDSKKSQIEIVDLYDEDGVGCGTLVKTKIYCKGLEYTEE